MLTQIGAASRSNSATIDSLHAKPDRGSHRNERRLIMYAQQKEAAFLQAQAHARRPAIAHEVLIALYCRELDEGLQAVRQQGGDAEADARPITRGRFSLERETRGRRRCLDQPSIDVAVAVSILMDPRDGRLRHHDAVVRFEANRRLHTQAALHRGLIQVVVSEFQTRISLLLDTLEVLI